MKSELILNDTYPTEGGIIGNVGAGAAGPSPIKLVPFSYLSISWNIKIIHALDMLSYLRSVYYNTIIMTEFCRI